MFHSTEGYLPLIPKDHFHSSRRMFRSERSRPTTVTDRPSEDVYSKLLDLMLQKEVRYAVIWLQNDIKTEIELKKRGNYSNCTQHISDVIGCAHGEKTIFVNFLWWFSVYGVGGILFSNKPVSGKSSLHQGLIINSCYPCYPVSVSICQHNLTFWQSNMVCCTIHQQ